MLPKLPNSSRVSRQIQTAFGGLDHNPGANDGSIFDMQNLTGDFYPLLGSRSPRYLLPSLSKPNGIYAHDGLFTVDGTALKLDGVTIGAVEDSAKTFCSLGNRVIIFPDKLCYHMGTGVLSPLEASYSATGLVFGNGTYAGEEAELNSITATGDTFPFLAGDAVTISGCSVEEHNKTSIIREISQDGRTLRFYENVFVQEVTEAGRVTLARTVPDLDYLCENENRLWGCKGDTIWSSKLGDPFNWNVFDGISTDAFSVDVGSAGDFTGCISYLGYPVFFKSEQIYKVYGDKPSNFQVMGSASLGVAEGSHRSLAIAGEVLFYLSRAGIVAYSGGTPQSVSAAFGSVQYRNGVAGSDGVKYYVSLEDMDGGHHLFVYDTRRKLWYRETAPALIGTAWQDGVYLLGADGQLMVSGAGTAPAGATAEGPVESMAEFVDFDWNVPTYKTPIRLMVRLEMEAGAIVIVKIRYDGGAWETVASMTTTAKRSWDVPAPIRRCDHYALRLVGSGGWKLHGLGQEYYSTSSHRRE